jgi:hypothetical protein
MIFWRKYRGFNENEKAYDELGILISTCFPCFHRLWKLLLILPIQIQSTKKLLLNKKYVQSKSTRRTQKTLSRNCH